jgi:hypothetical protein
VSAPLAESRIQIGTFLADQETVQTATTNLQRINKKLGIELIGVRDEQTGAISWTYTINSVLYFSAITDIWGTQGDLTIPANIAGAEVRLHWQDSAVKGNTVRTVIVRTPANGNYLNYTLTFPNGSNTPGVSLVGTGLGGTMQASWTPIGGSVTMAQTAFCWQRNMQTDETWDLSSCPKTATTTAQN